MTARFSTDEPFPVPAQLLFETLTDPDFQRIKALDRAGVLRARCTCREDGDRTRVLVLDLEQKPRIGRKNEHSTLTIRWQPDDLSATWQHVEHAHRSRVRAEGRNQIVPDGDDRCRYRIHGEVEIRIPLVGRKIEKRVAGEFKKQRAHERRYVCRHLGVEG